MSHSKPGMPDELALTMPPAEGRDLIGQTVGNYRVIDYLGAGGMGTVYLAEHTRIGQAVALKVLHAEMARDPKVVQRFEDEAKAAARAGHRNIVQVFDFGSLPDGRSYFVMERLKGKSLGELLGNGRTLPPQFALAIAREIALALGAAHRAGIVHRDLKPENVFLVDGDGGDYSVKVLDFGIAKLQWDPNRKGLTEAGVVFGTPSYMSPEQARGAAQIDGRADIYALGVVMYSMVTGAVPFVGDPGEVLARHIMDVPVEPRVRNPDVPPVVAMMVMRALQKQPSDRFQTADELVAAIDQSGFVASRASTLRGLDAALPASTETLAVKAATGVGEVVSLPPVAAPKRGQGALAVAGAALLLLGATAAGAVWWLAGGDAPEATEVGPAGDARSAAKESARKKKPATDPEEEGDAPPGPARAAGSATAEHAPAPATVAPAAPAAVAPVAVTLRSEPVGASVQVEGEDAPRGPTPIVIPVRPGTPTSVTVRLSGHDDVVAVLDPAVDRSPVVKLTASRKGPTVGKPPRAPRKKSAEDDEPLEKDATLKPTF